MMRTVTFALAALAILADNGWSATQAQAADETAVLKTYADIAAAKYGDSLATAKRLDQAVEALLAKPGEKTLAAARKARQSVGLLEQVLATELMAAAQGIE